MADDFSEEYDFSDFDGYPLPNTTPVPDDFFDKHMPFLSAAELKVMLYIFRRTLGFKRQSDNISIAQMLNGIVRQDGRRLDYGTGLSKPSLLNALKSLAGKNLIIVIQRQSVEKGNEPSNYRLNFKQAVQEEALFEEEDPLVKKVDQGELKDFTPLGQKSLPRVGKETLPREVKKVDQALGKKSYPTRNSSTTNSSSNTVVVANNNNSEPEPDPVSVALLMEHGITRRVAEVLVLEHPEEHIRTKVDYLEFLQAARPDEVANPPGWLRQAIVEDYAPPPGFVSASELAAREAEEERRRAAEAEAAAKQEAQQRKEQARRERSIAALRRQYGTTPIDIAVWTGVMQEIQAAGDSELEGLLADALILQSEGSTLLVGIESQQALRRMEHPRTQALLRKIVKRALRQAFDVTFVAIELT